LSLGAPPKIGEPVIVSVQRTGFHLSLLQITQWLELFGTIEGELRYIVSKDIPGVLDDTLEVLMRLRIHIPSPLPAYSRKLYVRYRGQQIQCSKCANFGHTRKYCKSDSTNWMDFVKKLVDSGNVPIPYFGNWYDFLQAQEIVLAS